QEASEDAKSRVEKAFSPSSRDDRTDDEPEDDGERDKDAYSHDLEDITGRAIARRCLRMLALPLLRYRRVLLSRVDLVVESQQAILPVSLRAGGDKGALGVVIHQRIRQRAGDAAAGNVRQPGSVSISTWFLQVEDKEHSIIRVFVSDAVVVEDPGGELVRVARQVIEDHHRDLKPVGLCLVRARAQLLQEALWDASGHIH